MSLTSIGQQKTPGRPLEITDAVETGLPSDQQEILLIGHKDATSGTADTYEVVSMSAVSDLTAATEEANERFGEGSELAKMVIAAVRANSGRSTFPNIKCVPLDSADTDFGASDEALTAAKQVKAEFLVSPYDLTDSALLSSLQDTAEEMSGAQRVHNNQFGTIGVAANQDEADPANLPSPDSKFLSLAYLRDANPEYSVGELAAAYAAVLAGNISPFNPVDNLTLGGVPVPAAMSDWLSIGAGLESEAVLTKGITPLKVKPNGSEVAIVRSVTTRITSDGSTAVTSYYDVQDYQVLYFWRKTLFTRLSQPDLTNIKASNDAAKLILSEVIRLAKAFEDQNMFQAVNLLAKKFKVERNLSDRHRFDILTPVNVIPGLHVVAGNIQASTEGDELTI